ncbi:MAG: hypothetical protein IJ131_04335 [Eggerthellaceae bacterium]|nr:hypothetical protein [Eggerthellaceae bacterium]
MNERIQGVDVYGGGPVQHYVFTAHAQRERKRFLLKMLIVVLLAIVCAWCMRSAFLAIAEPPQATADPAPISQVHTSESVQQPAEA